MPQPLEQEQQPNVVPMGNGPMWSPVNFQFSTDFKSAALWALAGVIAGMLLSHYLTSGGKQSPHIF